MKQSASPPQRLIPSAARPTRLELGLVLALFLAGGGLRCAYPERMAVEHFDEGVYASNHWFGPTDDFRYPSQHLYAPPLLPSLIDWIFTLWGPSDLAAMVPSLVAGCLTVPLMWWIGRSWFSPVAGLAAATIAAFSDPHIAFSRTALTDVMLCFWLLLAVHCIWRALNGRGLGATLGAGFFTGLAWWTKYNGWLPLAIGGAGLLAWWLANRLAGSASESTNRNIGIANVPSPPDASEAPAPPDRAAPPSEGESLWALVARMGWIAAVAFLIWLPWLWSLQSHGGYAAVASNHRGYVVGISGWWGSLETQFDNLQRLDGTASRHGLVLSLLVALVWIHRNGTRFTWNGGSRLFIAGLAAGLTLVMGVLLGGCVGGALLGLAGLAATLVLARRIPETSVRRSVLLATWLLAAWFIGLGLVTPSYAAYPRLLLPWIVATWLAGGLAISHLGAFLAGASHLNGGLFPGAMAAISPNRTLGPIRGGSAAIALTLVLAAIFAAEWWGGVWDIPAWEDRTALRRLARQPLANGEGTTEMAPLDKSQCAIYTLSEPALLFQWRLAGYELVRPVSSLDLAHPTGSEPLLPTFLAIGEQAERGAGFAADFNQGTSRLKEIQMSELDLSCLVLLDNRFPAGRPDGRGDKPRYRLRFYRLQ